MAVYSVHLQGADAAGAAFVREGFSRPAFFLGPLWLLAQRLWLSAALWCAAVLILLTLLSAGVLSGGACLALLLLLQTYIGLEAGRLIAASSGAGGITSPKSSPRRISKRRNSPFIIGLGHKRKRRPSASATAARRPDLRRPPQAGAPPVIGSLPTPE